MLEAVRLVRAALRPDQAVVGFCGGPFTVAGYLVEGKPSREFALTKSLMLGEPDVWHALLAKLAETFAGYVAAKVRAGADVIQLFDSWVGALSPAHYRELRRAALGRASLPRSTCRRSISAPAPRHCSRRWLRPAAT